MQRVRAFVLAGGKSTRMGRDKAFVPWGGRTLLERALEVTRAVAGGTVIVGPKAKFAPYGAVVEDAYPERGPLGGIHAALSTTDCDVNLILAVDLPFVTAELLLYVIERARDTDRLATVPRLAGSWEPLCAVYRKDFAAVAEEALHKGQNAVHRILEAAGAQAIEEEQLRAVGFPRQMFRNFNTMMDLASSEATPNAR